MLVGSPPGAATRPIGKIAGDLGDGAVLQIDLDHALDADLGDDKFAVGVYRRFSGC
jgi:hypothetical protein